MTHMLHIPSRALWLMFNQVMLEGHITQCTFVQSYYTIVHCLGIRTLIYLGKRGKAKRIFCLEV